MAEVTNLTSEYIWLHMPLAIGRQFVQVFYSKHRVNSISPQASVARASRGLEEVV